MKLRWNVVIVMAALACAAATSRAEVRLPSIFSDHMVLQRDAKVPVWGWADPSEAVTVTIGDQTKSVTADAQGKWRVDLANLAGGDTMTVKGKNTITIKDVLVGEVWLCSGQSNMGMTVSGSKDFDKEKADAANYPKLRMFKVQNSSQPKPQDECKGSWTVCSPETVGGFSAAAYFFGREVHKALGVPMGLINSSWGGTAIEAWTSLEGQSKLKDYAQIAEPWAKRDAAPWDEAKAMAQYQKQLAAWKAASAKAKAENKKAPSMPQKPVQPILSQNHPANLYNGMIQPLIPFAINGAIWYQGEANAGRLGGIYGEQLTALIKDWRTRWGYDFPFGWVQLPDFMAPQKEVVEQTGWVLVREGMLKTLRVPKTGMAVTLGLGEADNIHPKNKQEVGRRLAQWALADVYKMKDVVASGPLPVRCTPQDGSIVVSFKYANGGLVAKDGELKGFAIAGADKKWVKAEAKIVKETVVVSSPEVAKPVAVRYAWANNPVFNLYNGAGLPATPFRSDNWE